MIYQTYHLPGDYDRCFGTAPYCPFDLNAFGLDPLVQTQLSEYAAIRYIYEHPDLYPYPWIGFTSVNQHTETRFQSHAHVERLLEDHDALVWGYHSFVGNFGQPVSMLDAAALTHPGINEIMRVLLRRGGYDDFPQFYKTESAGPYHNYWAMSRERFSEYVGWSLPLVEYALSLRHKLFFQNWPRGVAYIHERLFICWVGYQKLRLAVVNKPLCGNVEAAGRIERARFEEAGKVWVDSLEGSVL